ncbi:predicted protein [Aspergillus terreus NIH2624]|uniref:Extracellular membrane protein CFEM domain-containing protein n=1 Tax=Aspergillus terreus (strain NIH 2624 / FGSC A1156) TaxID=341663 RepID=Q0CDK1_ASPTN|nr:uncharacterized protein ATEG_08233 [Aspergillus terreus NIH2624]EAU31406.1 predicted protein [Aspergillus terreus NIH2624]
MSFSKLLAALLALEGAILTLAQSNITADVCADPAAFTSCTAKAVTDSKQCIDVCDGNKICVLACGCVMYQSFMNCVAESCWNQAYSCEYGKLVAAYFAQCPTASEPIPFWPAPDNAPTGCSCNLGKVLRSVIKAQMEHNACITDSSSMSVIELANKDTACECCEVSAGLSAMYETCPDTIPADMGADQWLTASTLYGTTIKWDSCGSVLGRYDCTKLKFAAPSTNSSTFYGPDNLPPNGTQPLYNTGAADAMTAPPSGSVMTWSQTSITYIVTTSPWKNDHVKATGTGTGTGAAGTAGTAAKASETGAAMASRQSSSVAWLPLVVVIGKVLWGS